MRAQIARGKLMSESNVTKPLEAWNQDSFLPEDYVKSKGERRANLLSLTLFGVMMLAVVAAFFATNRRWMGVRNEQQSINAMYVREAEKIEELKDLEMQRAEMVTKAEVTAALVERVPRSVLFAELVSRMPKDVTLTEFELNSQEVKASRKSSRSGGVRTLTGGSSKSKSKKGNNKKQDEENAIYIPQFTQTLRIVGVGLSNDNIADYIENLRQCDLLDTVELKYIKESKIDSVLLRNFELSAMIRKDADARGILEEPAPVEMPEVVTPDRLVPQMPLLLPLSAEAEEAAGGADAESIHDSELDSDTTGEEGGVEFMEFEEAEAHREEARIDIEEAEAGGDITLAVPALPAMPSFGNSQSMWGSPSGLFDLMGSAARTAERVRSEKAAQEILDNPVTNEDEFVAEEAQTEENAAEEPAESPANTGDAETGPELSDEVEEVPAPARFWFIDPPIEADSDGTDEGPAPGGDADESGDNKEDE